MRVVTELPVKCILRRIYPMKGTWRTMTISVPNKQENEELGGLYRVMNEKVEPLVAFNKPRLPPVLGPLVVLSFLEMLSSNGDD
ncbi:unnamed protein product [Musa acuminata subsp. malaccensis]|uniref:(wild Malaysian banana) hypothetical protein n=1 Tax=Musa acuminata subsp. malaccensis TaxID=214687 RepID=A0A804IT15_MUSAM|nr:unnamed protein product [Musa acuminata subsp. malaccensis]